MGCLFTWAGHGLGWIPDPDNPTCGCPTPSGNGTFIGQQVYTDCADEGGDG